MYIHKCIRLNDALDLSQNIGDSDVTADVFFVVIGLSSEAFATSPLPTLVPWARSPFPFNKASIYQFGWTPLRCHIPDQLLLVCQLVPELRRKRRIRDNHFLPILNQLAQLLGQVWTRLFFQTSRRLVVERLLL
jgi:hypothetical protein